MLSHTLRELRKHEPHISCCRVLAPTYHTPTLSTQAAVFKPLLAVADLYPALVHGVLPLAMRAVEEVEGERGSGTDSSLRYAGMVHQITWASISVQAWSIRSHGPVLVPDTYFTVFYR